MTCDDIKGLVGTSDTDSWGITKTSIDSIPSEQQDAEVIYTEGL